MAVKASVRAWCSLHGLGRYYEFLSGCRRVPGVFINRLVVRFRYAVIVCRIRNYDKSRKIRVLFLVSNTSKWKTQSLYEKLSSSESFEPVIALTPNSDDLSVYGDVVEEKTRRDSAFFENLGDRCLVAYDFERRVGIPLSHLSPDLVFYQEPGYILPEHSVERTSRHALCCYIPYAIETGGHTPIHNIGWFHQLMYLRVLLNEVDVEFQKEVCPWWCRAGRLVGAGHPMLDLYYRTSISKGPRVNLKVVVYAPHFSFYVQGLDRPFTLSSFLENGEAILAYAREHREFVWLFKPHPHLKDELVRRGVWSKARVEAYYASWAQLGACCYDGNYVDLFVNSYAMITDCGSFLCEYPVTGHPLIRLIPKHFDYKPRLAFKKFFDTLYTVRNLQEMYSCFHSVLEKGEDPLRVQRLAALNDAGLGERNSADEIFELLKSSLCK